MSRASVLARGRAAAETGMTDTCLIQRETLGTLNGQTGEVASSWATVYNGPCRVQQRIAGARAVDVGEAYQLLQKAELQLPVNADSAAVQVGDRVTVTAASCDPDLAGHVFRVRELPTKSEATARRFGIEETT